MFTYLTCTHCICMYDIMDVQSLLLIVWQMESPSYTVLDVDLGCTWPLTGKPQPFPPSHSSQSWRKPFKCATFHVPVTLRACEPKNAPPKMLAASMGRRPLGLQLGAQFWPQGSCGRALTPVENRALWFASIILLECEVSDNLMYSRARQCIPMLLLYHLYSCSPLLAR